MITLQVNGIDYSNFTSAMVSKSLDELSGQFEFYARTDSKQVFPFAAGDECTVNVDDELFLTGFIEILHSSYDDSSHEVTIAGRDRLADLIDSTVGEDVEIKGGLSLKSVIEKIISTLGTDITVEDDVGDLQNFSEDEKISIEIGTSYFDACEQYARKRQVLLTGTPEGNIRITRGGTEESGFSLINSKTLGNTSNIKSASFTQDFSGRFNTYNVRSALNLTTLNFGGETSVENIASSAGDAVDTDIRSTRVLNMLAEKASSKQQSKERAVWQANINRARSLSYSATVFQHSNINNGQVWSLNTLVSVDDDFSGCHGKLLLSSIRFVTSVEDGNVTDLGFVNKDAYQLEASEPVAQKQTNSIGGLF